MKSKDDPHASENDVDDDEELENWWNYTRDSYDESRALALQAAIIRHLLVAEDLLDDAFCGYWFIDGTAMHVAWGEYEYAGWCDIYCSLIGEGFDMKFRLTTDFSETSFEESLWVDYVSGSEAFHRWVEFDGSALKLANRSGRY